MTIPDWIWILLPIAFITADLFLHFAGEKTLSERMRQLSKRWKWFKWIIIGAFAWLMYHLFWDPSVKVPCDYDCS